MSAPEPASFVADPVSPADRAGAEHADYIFNRLYLDAVVKGIDDRDVDGVVDPGERRADLRGRADFIGLNYYFRSRVTGLGAPASTSVPLFDFLPNNTYAHPQSPGSPPCPTTCTGLGAAAAATSAGPEAGCTAAGSGRPRPKRRPAVGGSGRSAARCPR